MGSRSSKAAEAPRHPDSLRCGFPVFLCLGGFLMWVCVAALSAQTATTDRAKAEAMARRVNERIRALQREADRLAGEARTLLGDVRRLEVERDLAVEQLQAAEA